MVFCFDITHPNYNVKTVPIQFGELTMGHKNYEH